MVPDYYDVIKEPMAVSTIKDAIRKHSYKTFNEFVRAWSLISHNAQLYNRPEAGAYQDALVIRVVFEKELKKVVDAKEVSEEDAALPDLGEIPPPSPRRDEDAEEEEEDDDEEDDDDGDDSDDDGRPRRRRGPRSTNAITKREGGKGDESRKAMTEREADLRRKRGRPPRVDTPMEARIKSVLKGLRKIKDNNGEMRIRHFEKLPDKGIMPEYFEAIKVPMAMDVLKKKSKRKKYQSVDHFMRDVETMFENAKAYNLEGSEIYHDAILLQREARHLAEQEKKRPDTDFTMEDGRIPLPNGIVHNGELWKVGDWVHVSNPNDLAKPIVAQIYRTWQDTDGQKWVNACWYYRPEQTVHRFDKHFFDHEVVKTGQYRDHHIDEVVDRCFVMFFTRFNKGRPRGFPPDKEVYVCESRYNEEKFKLNKIKTWASCLPDEVREKDYEMDLFEHPRKMRKVPSPILHLLPETAKETDDLPKPTWGVANAPPVIGAVHKRPRASNVSLLLQWSISNIKIEESNSLIGITTS
jgi:chromatin structure-remodeling complex subunit RSC1/2